MADRGSKGRKKLTRKTSDAEPVPDFPEEWISLAAYYIWKSEGEPEGREDNYWEKAKLDLANLWREGRLSKPE
jgi:hypothetical protein